MGNFNLTVSSLGSKFIDYRTPILGDSFNWHWVRPLSQPQYLAIHHTAGPDTQTPDQIAAYHVNSRGWGGVGYHFLIAKNGTVYYVGDLTTARAHVYNYNHLAIGICLIGNFTAGKMPSTDQIQSAHLLCVKLLFQTPELSNVNGWEDLVGHKQFAATACPGDNWPQIRQKIITGIGVSPDDSKRLTQIAELYRVILGREPDQDGLNSWDKGGQTIDQIRKSIVESIEHQQILNRAKNLTEAKTLAAESLALSTQVSGKIEKITKLGQ